MRTTLLVPAKTRESVAAYFQEIRAGRATPGGRFGRAVSPDMTDEACLATLLNTKLPQIFAESAVAGDGSDWNLTELGLLGDLSIAAPVTIHDDGRHENPALHKTPFPGELVFTPEVVENLTERRLEPARSYG